MMKSALLINLLIQKIAEHKAFVDANGLRSGEIGPLDLLIQDLNECLKIAQAAKTKEEEDDDE